VRSPWAGKSHDPRHEAEELAAWARVAQSAAVNSALCSPELDLALNCLAQGFAASLSAKKPMSARTITTCSWLRVRGTGMQFVQAADYFYLKREVPHTELDMDLEVARERACASCSRTRLSAAALAAAESEGARPCKACGNKRALVAAAWIPLGPWPLDGGALAVLPGSHRYSGFRSDKPAKSQLPARFAEQAKGEPWVVAALEPGDVLILDAQLVKASTENRKGGFFRASLDKMFVVR
jgi:hypothetical protein